MLLNLMHSSRALQQISVILYFYSHVSAIPIDNGVVGPPTVECTENGINFFVNTRNPFSGRIFIKGEARASDCVKDFGAQNAQAANRAGFFVLFDRCGMTRLRMLNPRGMMQSIVVVVSFHPVFITKVDKAYRVQCFYGEIEKTLTAVLDVSMLPTEDISENLRMPRCFYSIHRERPDGPEIRFSQIGDSVVHKWQCDQADMYRYLVKNCFVEDGENRPVQVIDENGCVLDPILLGSVNYNPTVPYVYAESHVFKFADRANLNFICQIQICLIMAGGCSTLLPPRCNGTPSQPGFLPGSTPGTNNTGFGGATGNNGFPGRNTGFPGGGFPGANTGFPARPGTGFGGRPNFQNNLDPNQTNSTQTGPVGPTGSGPGFVPGNGFNENPGSGGSFAPGSGGNFGRNPPGNFNNGNGFPGNGNGNGFPGNSRAPGADPRYQNFTGGSGFSNDTTSQTLPSYNDLTYSATSAPQNDQSLHLRARDSPLRKSSSYRKRRQTQPGDIDPDSSLGELDVQRDIVALDADDDLKEILEAGFRATGGRGGKLGMPGYERSSSLARDQEECLVGPVGLAVIVGTLSAVALLLTVSMCVILTRRNKGLLSA